MTSEIAYDCYYVPCLEVDFQARQHHIGNNHLKELHIF